jgi:hypothetical protein
MPHAATDPDPPAATPAGLPQWCSVAPHVDPLLCGVTAVGEILLWWARSCCGGRDPAVVGEILLWDVSREGLPLLDLIKTKDPRLKQIRLFCKQLTNCTADMAYHQMAPILSSALEACQLSKTKVGCCWSGCRRVPRCCGLCRPLLHAQHLHAHVRTCARRPC